MKLERFEELYKNRTIDGDLKRAYKEKCNVSKVPPYPNGLTLAEHEEIMAEWDTMSGMTCYFDAFFRLWNKAKKINAPS